MEVSHTKFWDAFQILTQATVTQDNYEIVAPMNLNGGIITTKV